MQQSVEICIRIDNPGGDGEKGSNTARTLVEAGSTKTFECRFKTPDMAGPFWGMRGVPELGPLPGGSEIDPAKIAAFQFFLAMPEEPKTLILDNIRLFGGGAAAVKNVPLPFVDQFGQYKHTDWSGKIHSEAELKEKSAEEAEHLKQMAQLPNRTEVGGWAEGPQRKATGWFRTEKVEGKWWLVTPQGRLFFSTGIDCVGTWEQTFVEGRDTWFDWLPEEGSPAAQFYGHAKEVHSMAEPINGEGRTFGFYRSNLLLKYGEDWPQQWQERTIDRLRSWGFNTVGNWSDANLMKQSQIPFVANAGISGNHRKVEGGSGYWGKMHDVYDPEFARSVENSLGWATRSFSGNPLCIGYCVDNELAWGSDQDKAIAVWALNSPADQPARLAFVNGLRMQYGSLEALNTAWGTEAETWEELRAPWEKNETCKQDLDAFVYRFSKRYFGTIDHYLGQLAPHHLYLGARFSGWNRESVRAAAEECDAVSFNIYRETVDPDHYRILEELDCPAIIGEFHFGALDRGMFHTGLVAAKDQEDRAAKYERYVESVADHPNFIGCHWFQYVDEPITGRNFDGENYNIGFVTIVDQPYPEMVESARRVHEAVYERRWSGE
jgi:hypothetical protein